MLDRHALRMASKSAHPRRVFVDGRDKLPEVHDDVQEERIVGEEIGHRGVGRAIWILFEKLNRRGEVGPRLVQRIDPEALGARRTRGDGLETVPRHDPSDVRFWRAPWKSGAFQWV